MSNYGIGLQRAKAGYKVVLFSTDNGKLVLAGEVIKNLEDARASMESILNAWSNKRNTLSLQQEVFPASKKWPKNAGPPKKKAAKKAAKKKK